MVETKPTTEQKWTKLMERVTKWLAMLFWSENEDAQVDKTFMEKAIKDATAGDDDDKKAAMLIISGLIKRYQGTENACPGGKKPGNPESVKASQTIRDDPHLLLRLLTLREGHIRGEKKMQEICINRINRIIKNEPSVNTAEDVITFLREGPVNEGDVQ